MKRWSGGRGGVAPFAALALVAGVLVGVTELVAVAPASGATALAQYHLDDTACVVDKYDCLVSVVGPHLGGSQDPAPSWWNPTGVTRGGRSLHGIAGFSAVDGTGLTPSTFTITAFVRPSPDTYDTNQSVFSNYRDPQVFWDGTSHRFYVEYHGWDPLFPLQVGPVLNFDLYSPTVAPGVWHQVGVRFDGSIVSLFVDGRVVDSKSVGSQTAPSYRTGDSPPMEIGSGGGAGFRGDLDELGLYSGAWSDAEVVANFNTAVWLLSPNERLGCCNIGERQVHFLKAADPVDPFTGNFFENFTDLAVPGRGSGFGWTRSYNSLQAAAGVDSPFGFGWTGAYNMSATVDSTLGAGIGGVWVWQENGAGIPFSGDGSGGYVAGGHVSSSLAVTDSGSRWTLTRNGTETIKFSKVSGVEYGKVKEVADLAGNVASFSYDSSGLLSSVTDPAGRSYAVAWTSSSPKHVVSVTDPVGRTVSYQYNDAGSAGHLTDVVDVRGQTTHYTYDSSHRLLTVTDPLGHTVLTNHYDANGRVDQQTDALSHTSTLTYNVDVDPPSVPYTTVTDRNGNQTRYEFGVAGLATKVTAGFGTAESGSWSYGFDGATLGVASVTDPLGHVTTTSYDAATGMPSEVARPGITGHQQATYNSYRLPTTVKDFNQNTSTMVYGSTYGWRVDSETSPIDATTNRTVSFGYDASHPGDLTSVTDGRGNVWPRSYQADGMLASTGDPLGRSTTFGYDLVGRPVWSVAPKGNASGGTPADYRSVSVTDRAGLVLLAADPTGRGVVDEFGRADSSSSLGAANTGESWAAQTGTWGVSGGAAYLVSGSNGAATVPVSSADGILVFSTPVAQTGVGVVFRYQDANNFWRLTADLGSGHNYWVLTQTVGGSVVNTATTAVNSCCDPGDAVSVIMSGTTVKVAVNGAVAATVTSSSLTTQAKVGVWAVGTGAGRIAPIGWSGLSGFSAVAYDKAGRVWRTTDANGNVTTRGYDNAGRLTTVTRADGSTLQTVFDDEGNVTRQRDSRSPTPADTVYGFDHRNRVATVTDPLGRVTTLTYLANGLPLTRYSPQPSGTGTYFTVTRGYDDADRLTSITYDAAGPSTPDVSFTYDDNGNRLTMADGTGKSCYSYDKLNRLTGHTNGGGSTSTCNGTAWAWAYDANSNVTQLTYPGNRAVTKHYDTANQMDWLTDWTSTTHVTFGYDANGALTSQGRPNNTQAAYTYDTAGAVTDIKWTYNTTTTLGQWTYTRDPASQVTAESASGVGTNKTYQYNTLEQLSKVNTTTYTYDSAENPTSIGNGTISGYDAANQYTTRTTTNTVTYGWDNNGNRNSWQLNSGTPYTFTFDQENRQTSMSSTSTYTYNGDGLRMKGNVWTAITNFSWDITNPVPAMLAAGNDYYVYGPGGLLIEDINPTASQQTWFSQDQYNSTRILTANNGTKTGDYTYDPWGNITSHNTTTVTGAISNTPLQWNTQYHHGDTGYYYLRARDYDPGTGQFTSRDPLNATTRSAYGYTYNNPLNNSDPGGLWCMTGVDHLDENGDEVCNGAGGIVRNLINAAVATSAPGVATDSNCVMHVTCPEGSSGALTPDYYTFDLTVFAWGGGGGNLTLSRSGKIYWGPEAGAGFGAGPSAKAGWIDDKRGHTGAEVDSFVSGGFANCSTGAFGAVGGSISSDGRKAFEAGGQWGGGVSAVAGWDFDTGWQLPWSW